MSLFSKLESRLRLTSLRRKIAVWLFVPLFVILGLTALFILRTYWLVTKDLVMDRNQGLTRLLARQIGVELSRYVELLEGVAADPDARGLDPSRQVEALERYANHLADFDGGVFVLDPQGTVVAADPRRLEALGHDWSSSSYCQRVVATRSPLRLSDAESDESGGGQVIGVAVPVESRSGQSLSVLVGRFRLLPESPSALFRSIVRLDLRIESRIFIVDSSGRAV